MAEFPNGRSAGEPGPPVLLPERPVQLHGSRVARAMLQLAGWRVVFDGLPARQGVLIVYPHTSNWDFVVGVLAKWCVGIPAMSAAASPPSRMNGATVTTRPA